MHLLLVDLYQFGQFLRIVAWIFFPLLLVTTFITVWLHHRKKKLALLAGDEGLPGEHEGSGDVQIPLEERINGSSGESNTTYKGLLWMKKKYEQYQEDADNRLEKVKDALATTEKKYLDLLATKTTIQPGLPGGPVSLPVASLQGDHDDSAEQAAIADRLEEKDRQISFLQGQLDQRISNFHQLEHQGRRHREKFEELEGQYAVARSTIAMLSGQLEEKSLVITDLTAKLDSNIRLLTNIHQELNRSLNAEDPDQHEEDHVAVPVLSA